MPLVVLNPELAEQILADREAIPDRQRREEVWDGVTFIMPDADTEHSDLGIFFAWVFRTVFNPEIGDRVQGPTNVTDRNRNWTKNYRCPDMCLFLSGNPAQDRRTHWFGGPDFALEIVSPDDRSRDKLEFYAASGTREVLILDRDPWRLELYQLGRGKMRLRGMATPGVNVLTSNVTPFTFQLVRGRPRTKIKIVHTETGQEWVG
ncbi:MAG TPA: Uma2 family endonuclease [Gemmataceae bacterium]|nr:Uma2 family endonuclease [Gemmataceae bacterium]